MVQVYSIAYVSHVDPPRTPCLENGKIAVRMIKDSCEDKANAPQFDAVFLDKWATLFPPGNSVADRSSHGVSRVHRRMYERCPPSGSSERAGQPWHRSPFPVA
jgi:hypothetical protein